MKKLILFFVLLVPLLSRRIRLSVIQATVCRADEFCAVTHGVEYDPGQLLLILILGMILFWCLLLLVSELK